MSGLHGWMAQLARCSHEDLKLISAMVDRLIVAERGRADTARVMLAARPEPATCDDARARIRTVIAYLGDARAGELSTH